MTSDHLVDLGDDVIDVIDHHAHSLPRGPGWGGCVAVFVWGGAVTRPPRPTPLGNRDARWVVHRGAFWTTPPKTGTCANGCADFAATCARTPPAPVWLNWGRGRG